jgi:peptidoglycan-associated lipoprotein
MHRSRFCALAAAVIALAASVPLCAQTSALRETGDNALRTHGHGIHAAASGTGTTDTSMLDTVAVASAPSQDSLDAADRARADSVEQARLAALDANPAPDTTVTNTPRADTVAVAAGRDSLDDRADSLGQANAALRGELAGLIHFEFDRSGIQPADRAVLDRKAAILTANPGIRVRIAGYCDDRGADGYNVALGNRRAAAAKQYLIERGIDADRLDAVSFGSASPVDSGQTEAAWALNRRAGFEVASGEAALTAPVGPSVGMSN